jgi:hypothetical protein
MPPAQAADHPGPAAQLPIVPRQPTGPTFSDAIDQYTKERSMEFAGYRAAADRAWQDYIRATRAAEAEYDQAVTQAGTRYDTTVAHLA